MNTGIAVDQMLGSHVESVRVAVSVTPRLYLTLYATLGVFHSDCSPSIKLYKRLGASKPQQFGEYRKVASSTGDA